jgi:LacI family transcriptional regulator
MARKTTAGDIAAAAGVSASTVDRVLNGRGGVHPDKERRVLEWARKLKIDRALDRRLRRTRKVAVLLQPPSNPFHAAVQDAFRAAGRIYADLNLQFPIFHVDPLQPRAIARLLRDLAARHDGLIVTCPDTPEIAEALDHISRTIPVITFATDVRNCGRQAYVGADNRRAGRAAGDLMGRFLQPQGGDVAVISGLFSMIGQEEREMGFRSVLRERYPRCTVSIVLESLEQSERAGDLVFTALRDNPAIRGIYNASAGAQTVVDALKALGRARDVVFITHELTDDRRTLLRDGLIDAIIDQNPEFEVRTAVETIGFLLGCLDAAPPTTIAPINIHMIENA